MITSLLTSLFRRSIVSSLTMSLLLGVGIAVMPASTEQAFAASASDPAGIGTRSDSNVQNGRQPPINSNPGSCRKTLPTNPIRDCGYASFGARLDVAGTNFRRATSGLPGPWRDSRGTAYDNGYTGQCQGEWISVYDPTQDPAVGASHNMNNAAQTAYWSTGVWWRDNKFFVRQVDRVNAGTVSVARYKYVSQTVMKKIPIPYSPGYVNVPTKEMVRVLNDPQTKTVLTTYDRINGRTLTKQQVIQPGGSAPRVVVEIYPFWVNRVVNYGGCNYPKAPKLFTNVCASSVGPGYMTGPYGNRATNPWPVPTGVGTYDPQTELKRWNTRPANANSNPYWVEGRNGEGVLYSDIGLAWLKDSYFRTIARMAFPPENPAIMQYIRNCPDLIYEVSARDQSCMYMGSTFGGDYGRIFPASNDYCDKFTPGNYFKEATGMTSTCQYAETYWNPTPDAGTDVGTGYMKYPKGKAEFRRVFLGCDEPVLNPSAEVGGWAHWLCNDSTGANGRNSTYNFADCSGPRRGGGRDVADTYRCVADNGGQPVVRDPESGTTSGPISQMLANGKQVQVVWPEPTGVSVLSNGVLSRVAEPENMWQNWDVVAGSEPINDSLSLSDSNQTIFGSYLANVNPDNSGSVLGGPGKDEWDTPWVYLRAYQSAPVNVTGSNVTVGTQTVGPDETLPLGVTTTFNATVQRTVNTGLGGTLEINVPVICKMPDAYLYVVAGRAID